MMSIEIADALSIHELGYRDKQEDSLYPATGKTYGRVFILCDGMGGHERGEVASKTVCETLGAYIDNMSSDVFTETQFQQALNAAYEALNRMDKGTSVRSMGTTLTFLLFHRGGCMAAHIGDSRIYQIRPSEKRILYRSRDHSLVQELCDMGEIKPEEMKTAANRNILTRAMQAGPRRDHADIHQITDIREGDYFYLCSDGMLEVMEDDEIVRLLSNTDYSDEEKRQQLLDATADNMDNHSAWLIRIGQVKSSDNQTEVMGGRKK